MCRAVLDSPWNSRANQRWRCSIADRKCIGIEDNQCTSTYVRVCYKYTRADNTFAWVLLPSDRICQGYPLRTSCSCLSVYVSVCVCLIFPLAKMINALGDNIRYSLFTYSLIHSFIRHSAFNIHWSLQRWCRHAGRPSLTHETSCFDKGALPQHQQRDTTLCYTHKHTDAAITMQYTEVSMP